MKTKRKVCGVGINDSLTPINKRVTLPHPKGKQIQKTVWACPFYIVWADMLKRCYSDKYLKKYPTYTGCSVCEDWLYFSKFKSWMEQQDWEGKELDKDLLVMGNKVYCPEMCLFVSKDVNYLFLSKFNKRGEYFLGVSSTGSKIRPYRAQCSVGKVKIELGRFHTELEAHNAWKRAKIDAIKFAMDRLTDDRLIPPLNGRVKFLEKSLEENTVVECL